VTKGEHHLDAPRSRLIVAQAVLGLWFVKSAAIYAFYVGVIGCGLPLGRY